MHSFICSENKYWVSTWARPHLGAGNTDFKHLCYQEVYMLLKGSIKYTKTQEWIHAQAVIKAKQGWVRGYRGVWEGDLPVGSLSGEETPAPTLLWEESFWSEISLVQICRRPILAWSSGSQTFWSEDFFAILKITENPKEFFNMWVVSINISHIRNWKWEYAYFKCYLLIKN